jgi:hypothetical protein
VWASSRCNACLHEGTKAFFHYLGQKGDVCDAARSWHSEVRQGPPASRAVMLKHPGHVAHRAARQPHRSQALRKPICSR